MTTPTAIRRLVVELHAPDAATATAAQQQVEQLHPLAAVVERSCLAITGPHRLDRIERVVVDLGAIHARELPAVFLARLRERLPAALAAALGTSDAPVGPPRDRAPAAIEPLPLRPASAGAPTLSHIGDGAAGTSPQGEMSSRSAAGQLELLALVARTGMLPWWADPAEPDAVAAAVRAIVATAPSAAGALLRELAADERALHRLARAVDDDAAAALAGAAAPVAAGLLAPLVALEALADLPPHRRSCVARFAVLAAAGRLGSSASPAEVSRAAARAVAQVLARPAARLVDALADAAGAPDAGQFAQRAAVALEAAIRRAAAHGMLSAALAGRLADLAAAATGLPALAADDNDAPARAALRSLVALFPGAERAVWEGRLASAGTPADTAYVAAAVIERLLEQRSASASEPDERAAETTATRTSRGAAVVDEEADRVTSGTAAKERSAARSDPAVRAEPRPRPDAGEAEASAGRAGEAGPPGDPAARGREAAPRRDSGEPPSDDVAAAGGRAGSVEAIAGLDLAFSDADTAYVANGGLVILAPFLPRLFARLGLVEDGGFVGAAARHRAAGLLHHAAAGDPAPLEYQVTLPKVLCGLAVEEPFDFGAPVTDAEAEEVADMLRAVIAHAGVFGEISLAGLRGTFLLRAAALRAEDGSWVLRVERQTFDVVLDGLPWAFGWVALPWMGAALRVEW